MKHHLLLIHCVLLCFQLNATILHVGNGYPHATLPDAVQSVFPGDTIRIHEGVYPGGLYFENLQGEPGAWITIESAPGASVIFEGGNNAWQCTDAAYLILRGIIFQHQTGNGLNFDDGGTYETPAHHIRFENCTFSDINATGNNDLLKLSGLDSFEIRSCIFLNGAEGGSGIDMVGCHDGLIVNSHFENLGSNSIQAKGGTRNIRIEANLFRNGGQRALNLGGSTGLPFFRPIDAPYEAAELKAYSNVFVGSTAPVAFVGSINCEFINNTIYLPEKWVLRILQETVDITRFPPCGNNTFRNNILYLDERVSVECNIGPNTDPGSFIFSNNFWYHIDNMTWTGPNLPAPDEDNIVGEDPLFENATSENFDLLDGSPAIGHGFDVLLPSHDHTGNAFNHPRSIGAFEGEPATRIPVPLPEKHNLYLLYPNPAKGEVTMELSFPHAAIVKASVYTLSGECVSTGSPLKQISEGMLSADVSGLQPGLYMMVIEFENARPVSKLFFKGG